MHGADVVESVWENRPNDLAEFGAASGRESPADLLDDSPRYIMSLSCRVVV